MSFEEIIDLLAAALVLLSAALSFAAGVGILRFPDVLSRLHAGTKPQVLGIAAILLAIALKNPSLNVITMLLVILAVQLFTQPLAGHMLGRAAYRTKHLKKETLIVDELAPDVADVDRGAGNAGDEAQPSNS